MYLNVVAYYFHQRTRPTTLCGNFREIQHFFSYKINKSNKRNVQFQKSQVPVLPEEPRNSSIVDISPRLVYITNLGNIGRTLRYSICITQILLLFGRPRHFSREMVRLVFV